MTATADYWRAVEHARWAFEFDEAAHPRGPGGHFISVGKDIEDEKPYMPQAVADKMAAERTPKQQAKAVAQQLWSGQPTTLSTEDAKVALSQWGSKPNGAPIPLHLMQVSGDGNQNLFQEHAEEIGRGGMPVIPGNPEEAQKFADFMRSSGFNTRIEYVDPRSLKATQNQLEGRKVGLIMTGVENAGGLGESTLVVDKFGNILDGHHRWAGAAMAAASNPDLRVRVIRVDTDIRTLLNAGHQFDEMHGISAKPFGEGTGKSKGGGKKSHAGNVIAFSLDAEMKFEPWAQQPEDEHPPDNHQAWVWVGGDHGWVLLATDDADGVPRNLTFPPPTPINQQETEGLTAAFLAAPAPTRSIDYLRVLDGRVGFDFEESQHPRGPGGKFEPTGGGHEDTGASRVAAAPEGSGSRTGELSQAQKDAVLMYQGNNYAVVNALLRNQEVPDIGHNVNTWESKAYVNAALTGGKSMPEQTVGEVRNNLEAAIAAQPPTSEDMTLKRTLDFDPEGQYGPTKEDFMDSLSVGSVITDPGFISAATLEGNAHGGAMGMTVPMRITLPAGSQALNVNERTGGGVYSDEHEVILPPGTSMVVTAKPGMGTAYLEATVVPK